MKISQRLTRAGLAFILFGSIAAVMPQQSGAASAENPSVCTTTGHTFAIQNSMGTASQTYTLTPPASDTYRSTLDNIASGTVTATSTGPAVVTGSGTGAVTVAPATGTGTVSLNATTTDSGVTYTAAATVTY